VIGNEDFLNEIGVPAVGTAFEASGLLFHAAKPLNVYRHKRSDPTYLKESVKMKETSE